MLTNLSAENKVIMVTQDIIILHHYPMSPFSEKIRAMFGYADMEWQSALTAEMPPRPIVTALTGGYRKIPVAQVGADIYCDTRTITSVIARHSARPELDIENCDQEIKDFVSRVEGEIFFACVMYGAGMKLNRKVLKSMSLWHLLKLLIDRFKMGRKAFIKMPSPGQAPGIVKAHLPEIESMLTGDYLFGNTPNIADFSAYHSLWFVRDLGEKPIMNQYPKTVAWMDRIKNFGHGKHTEIGGEKAIDAACYASPLPVDETHRQHDLIGELVRIAPADYAQDPATGILEGSTDASYIISRNDSRAGLVHVHFPKQGVSLEKA